MEKSTPYRNAWYRDLLEKEKELKEYTDEKVSNVDLSELKDVSIINVGDGQTLVYDAETEKWVNAETKQDVIVIRIGYSTNMEQIPLLNDMTEGDLLNICTENKDKMVYLLCTSTSASYVFLPILKRAISGTSRRELLFETANYVGIVYSNNDKRVLHSYYLISDTTHKYITRKSTYYEWWLPETDAYSVGKFLSVNRSAHYELVDLPSNDVVYNFTTEIYDYGGGGCKLYYGIGTTNLIADSLHTVNSNFLSQLKDDVIAGKNIKFHFYSAEVADFYIEALLIFERMDTNRIRFRVPAAVPLESPIGAAFKDVYIGYNSSTNQDIAGIDLQT